MTITVGVIGATGTTGGMVVEGLLSSSTDFVSELISDLLLNIPLSLISLSRSQSHRSRETPLSTIMPTRS